LDFSSACQKAVSAFSGFRMSSDMGGLRLG
jgi:hypothetical protein